ncbi:MAG TPA: flagellar basal body rod protein FlgB [Bacteroidota bacterium]|nr:flagellar basal body rod protein FlgB [Bacteroidota bacterium]
MIENFLFDKTKIPLLHKALGVYTSRQKVIAGNIANISTPGYKRQDVEFEARFNDALTLGGVTPLEGQTTQAQHIPINTTDPEQLQSRVVTPKGDTDELASGVNNVDIDMEMAQLAENQIRFKYASRLISESFKTLRRSITGSGSGA